MHFRILSFIVLSIPCVVNAQLADNFADDSPGGEKTTVGETSQSDFLTKLDTRHDKLSSQLERSVRHIDAFFADDRAYEDANLSHAQVTLESLKQEGDSVSFDARLRIKVVLPQTQKRLKLLIETDAEELRADETRSPQAVGAVKDARLSFAVEALLDGFKAWHVAPAIGVKPKWPLDPYLRLRATRYFELESWLLRFSSSASWYVEAGPLARLGLDFDRRVANRLMFRAASSVKWEKHDDEGERTNASEAFTLYHEVDGRRSVAYGASVNTDSDHDWAVQNYSLGVSYRHRLYRKWLFAEVYPAVGFDRINDWDDTASITLRIEALFGHRYR